MRDEKRLDAECIDAREAGMVLELPADDPVRRHAESCPRCKSLVASYQSFMEASPVEGAELERVRGLLDARIRADASRWQPARSAVRSFSWRTLMRPMPLFAAALVVVAAVVFWSSREPQQSSLRESTTQTQSFALNPAQLAEDGSIVLSWSPVGGADAYQVRLYGPDFGEIYRAPNTTTTSLTVNRTALPPNPSPRLDLTWRVFALSQGDVIATSAPGSIQSR